MPPQSDILAHQANDVVLDEILPVLPTQFAQKNWQGSFVDLEWEHCKKNVSGDIRGLHDAHIDVCKHIDAVGHGFDGFDAGPDDENRPFARGKNWLYFCF